MDKCGPGRAALPSRLGITPMAPATRIAIVINQDQMWKNHVDVFAGAYTHARRRGWIVDALAFSSQVPQGRAATDRYQGIIARADTRLQAIARATGLPVVNVWRSSPATRLPLVAPDFVRTGELAGEHLRARGFRRFTYIGYRGIVSTELERGFRRAVGDGECSRILIPRAFSESSRLFEAFDRTLTTWLKTLRPPVGVFTFDDLVARYLVNDAVRSGIAVPHDLAVVGYANEEPYCLRPEPSLTSIDLAYGRVGERAVAILDDLMQGRPAPDGPVLVPPAELVPRESTDVFASADPLVAEALRFMSDNSHRPIRVADVVRKTGALGRTLARHFQRERGCRVVDELTRMRIARAKRMLVEGDASIKQVARACGFANGIRLVVAFRKQEGMTPSEFRARK